MPRVTHDEPAMVLACPHCDEAGRIWQREEGGQNGDPADSYYCEKCRKSFNTPVERPEKAGGRKSKLELLIEQRGEA